MGGRLIFVVNDAGYFLSHRLALARAAAAAGWAVEVATPADGAAAAIEAAGLRFHPIPVHRFGLRPLAEARAALALWRLFRRRRPALVHIVTLKMLPCAGLAARLAGVPAMVLAVTGGGHLFTQHSAPWRALQAGVRLLLRALETERTRLLVQNPENRDVLAPAGRLRARAVLIRGSGVDLARFRPSPEPPPPVVVLLASRLIRKKGIATFVEAARRLRAEGLDLRFRLAGAPDPGNPQAIPEAELRAWQAEGLVDWLGRCDDMQRVLAESHLFCLPSRYGEGVPKALIEAAAAGRPLIATDIAGCREVVRDGVNGLLVPPGDAAALAAAIARLAGDPALRRRFGAQSRRIAEAEFGLERVIAETLAVYRAIAS